MFCWYRSKIVAYSAFILLVSCGGINRVSAQSGVPELPESSVRISGFGTLGLTHSSGPDGWGYRRAISQPQNDGGTRADTDSRLGVQLNYAPSVQFELVGQLVATRRSSYAPLSDSIEWAFAAYRPQTDLTFRIGRLNIDAFLLANYRNVGFAYHFTRPPVDFYASLPHTLDGADISKTLQFDDSLWRFKAYGGKSRSGDLSENARVAVKPVVGITTTRETSELTLRAGVAYSGLSDNPTVLKPIITGLESISAIEIPEVAEQARQLQARLDNSNAHVVYYTLSARYEVSDWLWTFEVTKVKGHPSAHMTSGYAGAGKRFDAVTLFAGVSLISSPNLPSFTPEWSSALTAVLGESEAQKIQRLGSAAEFAINKSGANQQSYSVGARWDFHSNMALKIQWDHIQIDHYGGRLWANATMASGNANVTTVLLDFIF